MMLKDMLSQFCTERAKLPEPCASRIKDEMQELENFFGQQLYQSRAMRKFEEQRLHRKIEETLGTEPPRGKRIPRRRSL